MRSATVVRSVFAALAGLLILAFAQFAAVAADPPGTLPTRGWIGHQKWDFQVEVFPKTRPGEGPRPAGAAAKPSPFRMVVLVSGTQRFADSLCWQVDFIAPQGAPRGIAGSFSILVGKRVGWPVKVIGAPPSAPSPFQTFQDASMLTAAPDGFPAELFPLKPFEGAATTSPASLHITRRTEGDRLVVEAEVRSGGQSDLLVRQRWVEGEPWWREYERYVRGEKDLQATRVPPAEVKNAEPPAAAPPAEPDWLAMLRDDPHLQAPITLDLRNQPLQVLLDRLSDGTSLPIDLSPELGAQRPLLGGLSGRAPAWQVMRQAALQNVVAGRWEKTDQGYRLYGERPVSVAPSHELPKGGCNWWLIIPNLVLMAALCVWALVYKLRHREEAPKA